MLKSKYEIHRKQYERKKIRWRARRQAALLYLGGRCAKCGSGIVDPEKDGLHFDHIDPKTKLFDVGGVKARNCSEETFWAEVEKCQLLCVPHHVEKTSSEGSSLVAVTGERNYQTHLSEDDVRRVRAIRPERSLRSLAVEYGVSKTTINDIVQGKSWKGVG